MSAEEVYAGMEPRELWRHFAALNEIPRPSGKEAAARDYVTRVAEAAGARWATDARGNTVVSVPATPGRDDAPPVAIQAHLDMVCEKRPGVTHDFDRDPIRPRREGDLVYGTGSTLGADNGIGAAAALAAMTDPTVEHGPMELIFTVEEETGLHGAANIEPSLVRARRLINLDSEDPRELTVGCAGGAGTVLKLPVTWEAPGARSLGREVVVSGLKGGHSGVQIHERLANAIKLLTRALREARQASVEFTLAGLRGGNAHNAIPRDAAARLAVASSDAEALERVVNQVQDRLRGEWGEDEPGLSVVVREAPLPERVMRLQDGERVLALLDALPHGILKMSEVFPGKVETSSNLAQIDTTDARVEVGTSSRSFIWDELEKVQARIAAMGTAAGAQVHVRDGYPGWEPSPDSPLLKITREVYRQVFGQEGDVQVVHAGLECGVIAARLPGLDAISFGPRIEGAHTPEERVYVSTVATTWDLLVALLSMLAPRK